MSDHIVFDLAVPLDGDRGFAPGAKVARDHLGPRRRGLGLNNGTSGPFIGALRTGHSLSLGRNHNCSRGLQELLRAAFEDRFIRLDCESEGGEEGDTEGEAGQADFGGGFHISVLSFLFYYLWRNSVRTRNTAESPAFPRLFIGQTAPFFGSPK